MKCKSTHGEEEVCDDEEISMLLKKKNVKKCPKCTVLIQKASGCNHMECKSCKTHICWNCLEYFETSR